MSKNLSSFELLFKALFKPLCGFAMKYTHDLDEAKDIVHNVFVITWEKFDHLPSDTNYRSYLYTAVRNRCLNYLRDKKKNVSLDNATDFETSEESNIETSELQLKIERGINMLPEKCREIFELNRFEGLKYAQIADKLGISVKTVEGQMSKALSVLRAHLDDFLLLLIIMWMP